MNYLLLTSLNRYDPSVYGGGADLSGCHTDSDVAKTLLLRDGDTLMIQRDHQCGREDLFDSLLFVSSNIKIGERFTWFHSGHGYFQDVRGRRATCRCLWDGPVWDSELAMFWRRFPAGSQIVTISDTCHSESNSRVSPKPYDSRRKYFPLRSVNPKSIPTVSKIPSSVGFLALSACTVDQVSYENSKGGVFTNAFQEAYFHWSSYSPKKPITYRSVFNCLQMKIDPTYEQTAVIEGNRRGLAFAKSSII